MANLRVKCPHCGITMSWAGVSRLMQCPECRSSFDPVSAVRYQIEHEDAAEAEAGPRCEADPPPPLLEWLG